MAFAENVRRLRLEHFLSQRELARLAGMHTVTMTRLEAGHQAPSTRTVRALAEALGVQPAELASPEEVAAARMLGRRRRVEKPVGSTPEARGDGRRREAPAGESQPETAGAQPRPAAAAADPGEHGQSGREAPPGGMTATGGAIDGY